MDIASFAELFGTLASGAIALLVVGVALWVFSSRRVSLARAILTSHMTPRENMGLVILVLSAYGAGVLIESVADDITDRSPRMTRWVRWLLVHEEPLDAGLFRMPTEESTRLAALFRYPGQSRTPAPLPDEWSSTQWRPWREPRSLMREIARHVREKDPALHTLLKAPGPDQKVKDWRDAVDDRLMGWFYRSSNWVYTDPTLARELDRLERSVEFGRGLYITSTIGVFLVAVAWLVSLILHRWRRPRTLSTEEGTRRDLRTLMGWETNVPTPPLLDLRARCLRAVSAALLLMLMGQLGRWTYVGSEQGLNERAFGYYVSHLDEVEAAAAAAAEKKEHK